MTDAPLATTVAATDQMAVIQPGGIVLATAAQVYAAPMAAIASLSATVVAQAQQIAALQSKPDPCVALTGSIPVATIQAGTTDVAVPVAGLLRTDTVSIEVEADLPTGLDLRAMHPDRTRDGYLVVQATAALQVALTAAVPIRVTALR